MNRTSAARGLLRMNIYRKLLCGVTLLCLAATAAAQVGGPSKKKPRSARAVALIEWHADAKGVMAPRLLPISFLWEEKYYDAGIYEASPRPLALEPGTVYEAMRSGVPAGLFTVRGAADVKGVWYGDGIWSPGVTGSVKGSDGGDDERPRLKRTAPGGAPPDANASPGGAKTAPEPEASDPNRPTLQRGKPAGAPASAAVPPSPAAAPKPAAPKPPPPRSSDKPEPLVAVSDEQTPETRPYLFQWNRDEEERLTAAVKALAQAAVAREAGEMLGLEQLHVRAFDLYYSNLPEIVLSARTSIEKGAADGKSAGSGKSAAPGKKAAKGLRGQPRIYYVTVVARVTVSGEVRKLFASVTSSAWLGSVPRMEVVDAVDADGDGNGDLLFSEITTSSHSYALYRVGRDELFQLVETGPLPND